MPTGAVGSTAQTVRTVMCIFPQAIKDNADWVGGKDSTPVSVDTNVSGVKYNSARVVFAIGATDVTIAAMNVYESDDDSTYTEIAGLDFVNDGTAPSATADNTLHAAFIDLRDKKRYLQVDATAGDGTSGTYLVSWVDLFDPTQVPNSDTKRGYSQSLSA